MGARTRGSHRREIDRRRLREFSADELATRPLGVVTAGAGSDYERVRELRVKHGLPVSIPVADADDLIDRD